MPPMILKIYRLFDPFYLLWKGAPRLNQTKIHRLNKQKSELKKDNEALDQKD